jgi:hypothetical protein
MRGQIFNGRSLGAFFYDVPNDPLRDAASPGFACAANAPLWQVPDANTLKSKAIVDLLGKARHVRTVPVPDWVKNASIPGSCPLV